MWAILLFQKIGTNSFNHPDSEETTVQFKTVVQFPGNKILKILAAKTFKSHELQGSKLYMNESDVGDIVMLMT